ncbi:hypothetical protein HYD80_02590 [Mycoplasmopsis bovis]|nr:hypothetical protein [Mycoplasmopsis bovis]QQH42867.1 hypothetical protein HYD80_02590 [Mycoplasmopsis bovis]
MAALCYDGILFESNCLGTPNVFWMMWNKNVNLSDDHERVVIVKDIFGMNMNRWVEDRLKGKGSGGQKTKSMMKYWWIFNDLNKEDLIKIIK